MTLIIKVDPIYPDKTQIVKAASFILEGGLVAFPTETVYGLGADIYNEKAVHKIFKVKGRPSDNPLIIHVANIKQFEELSSMVPEEAYKITKVLWPGPITIVVKKSEVVPNIVTASLPTVAIRMPAHPIAKMLIEMSEIPIAAPSANLSGRPSPTTAAHVRKDLMNLIDVIIDGGDTLFGVESTIIDLTVKPPTLLRPGPITVEDIKRLLRVEVKIPEYVRGIIEAEKALAPGMKYRHYAPKAKMILVETSNYENLRLLASGVTKIVNKYIDKEDRIGILCSDETYRYYSDLPVTIKSLGSRKNLYEVAKNLFRRFREMDDENISLIISEGFEERGLGLTIMNRMRKAAGNYIYRIYK